MTYLETIDIMLDTYKRELEELSKWPDSPRAVYFIEGKVSTLEEVRKLYIKESIR